MTKFEEAPGTYKVQPEGTSAVCETVRGRLEFSSLLLFADCKEMHCAAPGALREMWKWTWPPVYE